MISAYPEGRAARNRWVEARRGPRNSLVSNRAYACFSEEEIDSAGMPVRTSTILLTNRECPYRCVMCDLWKNTLAEPTPRGAIPEQIRAALRELPSAKQIKLYNAGSFFDPAAIPPDDYPAIAELVSEFDRVIVECHPKLIGARCAQFQSLLRGRLEVAIGLETVEPTTLERLNKGFDLSDFRRAAAWLRARDIALRVFLLVRPPFQDEAEGLYWAKRSLDEAFACGAEVCCLIATRGGNGAMEALAATGQFTPPSLISLETAQEYGIGLQRGRVFADLWELDHFAVCPCSTRRIERLAEMNRTASIPPPIQCDYC